jgi:hypothetical protein
MARDLWEMEQIVLEAKFQNGWRRLRLSIIRTSPCLLSRTVRQNYYAELRVTVNHISYVRAATVLSPSRFLYKTPRHSAN